MGPTLVNHDFPISQCTLRWDTIFCHQHTIMSSDILRDRCRVSEILDQPVVSLYDYKQLHHHVRDTRLDEFFGKRHAGRHNDCSVTSHVPSIQEGTDLPRFHLLDRHDRLRSDHRNIR